MNTRRNFLKMMALSAATSGVPLPIERALAIPAQRRSGTIEDVEHVVILMQENRSFDHYFGGLQGVRGFSDPRPALLPNGKSIWHQPVASVQTSAYKNRGLSAEAQHVLPFYLNPKLTTEYQAGTNHGWSSGHLAWNHGHYDSWVTQKQDPLTMGYLTRHDLSFHYALADAFTLCDAYFCSVHGDTCPNRIYLWSGTIDPRNVYGTKPNGPGLTERKLTNGYTWTTYPERLQKKGVSWKVYQGGSGIPLTPTDNYTDNSLEFFERYQVDEKASPSDPHVLQGVSTYTLRDLKDDVTRGTLPQVSWVVAPHKYSEHPEASSTDGAYYISLVLDALTANPEVWGKTVLFLNYDENDGLFDHVVPPMPPAGQALNNVGMVSQNLVESLHDEFLDLDKFPHEEKPLVPGTDPGGIQPIGLGPRVPMMIISPWTTGGWVNSQTFDHTSVLQFLEKRFGVAEPNISAWRRAVCGDLTSAFDFSRNAGAIKATFAVPDPVASHNKPYKVPPKQVMPTQEAGVRPARALPYDLRAECRVQKDGPVWVQLINDGTVGAAFYVYDRMSPTTPPRRYTVSKTETLSDYWAKDSTYHLAVYGPNGYVAEFSGNAQTGEPDVRVTFDRLPRKLIVQADGELDLHEAYTGETQPVGASLATVDGWFDLSVRSMAHPQFLRRYAGHIENGEPSTTDPGPRKLPA